MNIFENLRLQSIYLFDVVFVHLQTNLNTILLRVNQTQFFVHQQYSINNGFEYHKY